MRAERRALVLVVGARALDLAVAYAIGAAILHGLASGRHPVDLLATSAGACGVSLVLASVLRERGTARQSSALAAAVMGGSAVWGLTLPAAAPDLLAVMSRVIGFAILGEAYLWRLIGVARALPRWRDVRGDGLLALGAVAVAALVPGSIDRSALPVLALAVVVATAIALSLARSAEELELTGGQVAGRPGASAASGTAFALGVLAVALALVLPAAEALLADAAAAAGPILDQILFTVLLPLGYLAGALVAVVLWLRDALGFGRFPTLKIPTQPVSDAELRQRMREMAQARPFVAGAVEVLVALVALAFAAALVARLAAERRALVAEGVAVVRETVDGVGLAAVLGSLFPGRPVRTRPPADDGTPETRLRRLYWRLLDLAEREGPGRRAAAETPAEHERRLLASADRWRGSSTVVRAFEDLRYGERAVDAAAVERAAAALAGVEAAR